MGPETIILGNVPTVAVMEKGTPEDVRQAAEACRRALGERFILSAGCEVPRTTPMANMEALCRFPRQQ
jgi:uroporphyrinogen-III decarboxylase